MDSNNRLCFQFLHCGNISLANPQDREEKNIFFMPMGLFPMADVLNKEGVNVKILHTDLETGKPIHEILDFDTIDVVGFDDHWVNESVVVMETAALIKHINSEIFVVIGGYTASLFAEEILADFPQIDAVVRGDGEVPIVELVKVLHEEKRQGKSIVRETDPGKLKKVQNLVWRGPDGRIMVNKVTYTATAADLEKLDFAAVDYLRNWEGYRHSSLFYTSFKPIDTSPMFLLEVARGCEYACTFCGGNAVAQKRIANRTRITYRSVDSVLATIKKAISYGFETFYTSMEWEDSEDWYIRLFNRIKEEKLEINYAYGCYGIPSKALVDAMSRACNHVVIEISPETSNHELRKKNKDKRIFYTNQEMEECLDYINKKDNVKVQLFFGYYLFSDTRETILGTVRYIIQLLMKYPGLLEIEYDNFSTDPGSLFFFYPEEYDIDIKTRNFKDYFHHLKDNYVNRRGQPADMTAFKPAYITDEEDAGILRMLRLFYYLMVSFRKSVSYMLEKTGTSEVFMKMLTEADISPNIENKFSSDDVKNLLLDHASKNDLLDMYLSKIIGFEWESLKSTYRISKPTTQLFLDFEKEKNLLKAEWFKEVSEQQGEKISSEIISTREKIDADFDFL
jgi:hypothetical protein